jgi:xylulose-5-phosphate/fructose-6-phosphate phosphoketolase
MNDASPFMQEPQDGIGARAVIAGHPRRSPDPPGLIDADGRAANDMAVSQMHLQDNPLLRQPLKMAQVKPPVISHWGTTRGQNFIDVHLNRVVTAQDLDMFYACGLGHGGPAIVGPFTLE